MPVEGEVIERAGTVKWIHEYDSRETLLRQIQDGSAVCQITTTWGNGKEVSDAYAVQELPDGSVRLERFSASKVYTVRLTGFPSCDCEDQKYRCGPTGGRCKHLMSIGVLFRRLGLVR